VKNEFEVSMVHNKLKINASLWVVGGHFFGQSIRLASNLVLTRLLVPEAFATMAIVSIILMGLAMFSDIGIGQSIIRHKDNDNSDFLNTAWTIQVIRGGALWLLCVAIGIALWFAQTYNLVSGEGVYAEEVLPYLIAVIGFTAVVDGFLPTSMFTKNRELKMHRLTVIDLVSQVISAIVTISWALVNPSVWALVAGSLTGSIIKLILLRVYIGGIKNNFFLDKKSAASVLNFGKWIMLSSIVTFIAMQGDRLLLGHYITTKELGVYVIAFFLANSIFQVFSSLLHKVWFPVFCDIYRNSQEKLAVEYYNDRLKLDSLTFFIGGFLVASGGAIVDALYDSRYADAGWMLEVLSIRIALSLGPALGVTCMLAMGNSKLNFDSMLVRAVGLVVSMPICHHFFGLNGVVWAVGLNFIIGLPIIYWALAKEGLFILKKELLPMPILIIGYIAGSIL